jgi:hypothetical protein
MTRFMAGALPLLLVATSLPAQDAPQDAPPPLLQIFREEVKVGRVGAHTQTEAGWPRAFAKAGIKNYYFAITTVYGPQEAWFLEGHQSMAEIQDANEAIDHNAALGKELDRLAMADAANISAGTQILARYDPELSNPGVDLSAVRIWEVLVFRCRPGHENDFMQAAKLYKTTFEQAKIDLRWATYGVMAGMPGPTFLVFIPHMDLTELDPASPKNVAMDKAFTEESGKRISTLAEGYQSSEDLIFAVSPEMSHLPREFVARDPKFWGKKVALAKPSAAKPAQ